MEKEDKICKIDIIWIFCIIMKCYNTGCMTPLLTFSKGSQALSEIFSAYSLSLKAMQTFEQNIKSYLSKFEAYR